MTLPRAAATGAAALAAAALTSACGSTQEAVVVPSGPIRIEQRDFRFHPEAVRARAGRVTIALTNHGRLPHTFRLRKGPREWVAVSALLPGESTSVTKRLPRGTYRMLCSIGNHEELGMYGTLVLR